MLYVEDMTSLLSQADLDMTEDEKLRHLMQGVSERLFTVLVRSPPKTVAEFSTEATAIERALHQSSAVYDCQVNAGSSIGQIGAV